VLIRIVRMTFRPDAADLFLDHFDRVAPQIRRFDGCEHLALWRDVDAPACFTTHSHWTTADALDDYRHSDLFRSAWAEVKPLFAARPTAHSYVIARPADVIMHRSDTNE
jgi:quinol monooxygenase YgiN